MPRAGAPVRGAPAGCRGAGHWPAEGLAAGKIRYVLTAGTAGGTFDDTRVGSKEVMGIVAEVGTKVGSVSGLCDLQGKAAALRAAG